MNIWIDCEFNGFGGKLISMALVPELQQWHSFYQVLPLSYYGPVNPWVQANVIPVLYKDPCKSIIQFQLKLKEFLSQYVEVTIIADWPDDIKYFCEALITGPGCRMSTPILNMKIVRDDTVSAIPHNALEDAKAMRQARIGVEG